MALTLIQVKALSENILKFPEQDARYFARILKVSLVSLNRGLEQGLRLSLRDLLLSYRMRSWRSALQVQADVLDSALDHFGALSTAYRHAGKALGMTPARLKRGGAGERIHFGRIASKWGTLIFAVTEAGVCWMCADGFDYSAEELFQTYPDAQILRADEFFAAWLEHTTQRMNHPFLQVLPRDLLLAVLQHHLLDATSHFASLSHSSEAPHVLETASSSEPKHS